LRERKAGPTGSARHEPASVVLVVLPLGAEDDDVLLEVLVVDVEVAGADVVVVVEEEVEVVVIGVEVVVVVDDAVVEVVDDRVVVVGAVVVVEVVLVVVDAIEVVVVAIGTAPVQAENSEVSPSGAVAVAVMTWPAAWGGSANWRSASPDPSVVAWMAPRNVWPSPLPLASHEGVAKNSTVNSVSAVLLSVPVTCDAETIDSTG
jgi:hypothetical protein